MRISDWSSDVCSSDLPRIRRAATDLGQQRNRHHRVRAARLPALAFEPLANARMQNRLQIASRLRIVEHPRTQRTAIEPAIIAAHRRAEARHELRQRSDERSDGNEGVSQW